MISDPQITPSAAILPGQWLGMLGGGQLGRMFCQAAQRLGYRVAVLDPDPGSPAGRLADWHICAAYDDVDALISLSERCHAISTEFENIPAESLRKAAEFVPVRPSAEAVYTVQDRRREKAFFSQSGVPVAPYHVVTHAEDVAATADSLFPGILKAARFGYDGKGQVSVSSRDELVAAWETLGRVPCVLEAHMSLDFEISVVLARDHTGRSSCYPVLHNEHREGVLAVTRFATDLPSSLMDQAYKAAQTIAVQLDYVGVLCVEFFVCKEGQLVVNEVAPRPHNSGHVTMDACLCSQFEQQVRVLAGMPLGPVETHQHGVMLNLLGDIWYPDGASRPVEPNWEAVLAVPQAHLHLYGKSEVRPGRKMGHVNVVASTPADAMTTAARVAGILGIVWHG